MNDKKGRKSVEYLSILPLFYLYKMIARLEQNNGNIFDKIFDHQPVVNYSCNKFYDIGPVACTINIITIVNQIRLKNYVVLTLFKRQWYGIKTHAISKHRGFTFSNLFINFLRL
jgi:hypothetical protein